MNPTGDSVPKAEQPLLAPAPPSTAAAAAMSSMPPPLSQPNIDRLQELSLEATVPVGADHASLPSSRQSLNQLLSSLSETRDESVCAVFDPTAVPM